MKEVCTWLISRNTVTAALPTTLVYDLGNMAIHLINKCLMVFCVRRVLGSDPRLSRIVAGFGDRSVILPKNFGLSPLLPFWDVRTCPGQAVSGCSPARLCNRAIALL